MAIQTKITKDNLQAAKFEWNGTAGSIQIYGRSGFIIKVVPLLNLATVYLDGKPIGKATTIEEINEITNYGKV